jgi:hypothetical protein
MEHEFRFAAMLIINIQSHLTAESASKCIWVVK